MFKSDDFYKFNIIYGEHCVSRMTISEDLTFWSKLSLGWRDDLGFPSLDPTGGQTQTIDTQQNALPPNDVSKKRTRHMVAQTNDDEVQPYSMPVKVQIVDQNAIDKVYKISISKMSKLKTSTHNGNEN